MASLLTLISYDLKDMRGHQEDVSSRIVTRMLALKADELLLEVQRSPEMEVYRLVNEIVD